jgi:hypothetical protein
MIMTKALRRKIMSGTPPHGDPACGCLLCMLPRGGGWGEEQLEERLAWMGREVHRSMRALGDFILFGTMQRLPGPGTSTWVPAAPVALASHSKVTGKTTVIGIDRDVAPPSGEPEITKTRTLTEPPPVIERLPPYLDDPPIGMDEIIGGEGTEFDRILDDIMGLGLRGGHRARSKPSSRRLDSGRLDSLIRRQTRTRGARLSFAVTLTSDDRMEYISASPQRPFKARHLLVSTPENIDLWGVRVGNEEFLNLTNSPVDAVTFWMPMKLIEEWSPEGEQKFFARCALDVRAAEVGERIQLIVKTRVPGVTRFPFEFRAVLLGQEVVAQW